MFRLEDGPRVASLAHAGAAGGHGTLMHSCSRGVFRQLNSVDRAAAVMAVTAAFWIRRSAVIA